MWAFNTDRYMDSACTSQDLPAVVASSQGVIVGICDHGRTKKGWRRGKSVGQLMRQYISEYFANMHLSLWWHTTQGV